MQRRISFPSIVLVFAIAVGGCSSDKNDNNNNQSPTSGIGGDTAPTSGTGGGTVPLADASGTTNDNRLDATVFDSGGQPDGNTADTSQPPVVDSGPVPSVDSGVPEVDTGTAPNDDDICQGVIVADADCDTSKAPFVFVHGTFGSGDNIANVAMLFGSNGYCQDRFVAVEYNSLGGSPQVALNALVDKVLAETGQDKIVLAGHSQGTAHCGTYMNTYASKVSHYISYSGRAAGPGDILTLGVSSDNDIGGAPSWPSGPNVTQVNLGEEDHFANAASVDAFVETWKFLYGEEPKYKTIQCGQDPVIVEGIAESFGDNVPVVGRMEVYELDYNGPPRDRGAPVMELTSDASGKVGPIELKRNVPYEFKAFGTDGTLIGYVYFAPFKRSNRLARFLKPSDNGLIAMGSTDNIVRSPNHVAMIGRYLGGAFRNDLNNRLLINGNQVLTEANAGRSDSVVGLFMYDGNQNGSSELGALFGPANFLVGTDLFIDATTPAWIDIEWEDPVNGYGVTKMKIPNWPSNEALNLIYF